MRVSSLDRKKIDSHGVVISFQPRRSNIRVVDKPICEAVQMVRLQIDWEFLVDNLLSSRK
jgi:hypothetical protein